MPFRRLLQARLGRGQLSIGLCCLLAGACRLASHEPSRLAFEEVTVRAGIDYHGPTYGAAWGDFNGDGRPDIFVSNHSRFPSLYLNQGDGTFEERGLELIPYELGSAQPGAETLSDGQLRAPFLWDAHGAAWGDYDNDGDQDLFMSLGGSRGQGGDPIRQGNRLFENEQGRFIERGQELGVNDFRGRGRTPLWLDIDRDGALDLLLAKVGLHAPDRVALRQAAGRFSPCPEALPDLSIGDSVEFIQRARLFEWNDEHLLPTEGRFPDTLYRFTESCRFDRVVPESVPRVRRLADFAVVDLDNDLLSEIVIATSAAQQGLALVSTRELRAVAVLGNKTRAFEVAADGPVSFSVEPSDKVWWPHETIWIGAKGAHPQRQPFTLDPMEATTWGLAKTADPERRALIGYLPDRGVWRLEVSATSFHVAYIRVTNERGISLVDETFNLPNYRPSREVILRQSGQSLADVTTDFGLDEPSRCTSVSAADFDNDMDLDLYLVCSDPTRNLPNRLYRNDAGEALVAVAEAGGAKGSDLGLGDRVSSGDYDGDGFIDLFVTNGGGLRFNNGPHQLFRNLGNDNGWLRIDLVGTRSNRDAYGARAFVTSGGRTQVREKTGGLRRASQDQQVLHYGLGTNRVVEEVVVQWPTGALESFAVNRINQQVLLTEGQGAALGSGAGLGLFLPKARITAGQQTTLLAVLGPGAAPKRHPWPPVLPFSGLGAKAALLDWDFGDGTIAKGPAVMRHAYKHAGLYRIAVRTQDAAGEPLVAKRDLRVD